MPSLLFLLLSLTFFPVISLSDTPTTLLNQGCSLNIASDLSLNSTFSNLRSQLSNSSLFVTYNTTPTNSTTRIYSMFYCRPYLSLPSCLSCYANASAMIRTCGLSTGARVILNGCFLRYETTPFYDQTTLPGNFAICSNASSNSGPDVASLMPDLAAVTNKVNGHFAAAVRNGVYGVAECVQTVSATGRNSCLQVAAANVRGCLGKKEGIAVDAGCFMRFSDANFFGDFPTVDLQSLLSSSSGKFSNKVAIIGGVVGGSLLILFELLLFLWFRRSNKSNVSGRVNDNLEETDGENELELPLVDFEIIAAATDNFSAENKLGEGGFGPVYKGKLEEEQDIAVKRLSKSSQQGVDEFKNEVKLIAKLQHRNLVRLLGCCIQKEERMLIYEYLPNKSLDSFLFGKEGDAFLDWKTRYGVIMGIARGVLYLHHDSRFRIIHRDLKASNILLDKDMNPKISDFGMARIFGGDETDFNTRKVVGTFGYMSPEYVLQGVFSMKSDIFSFGVLVLEVITGKKNRGAYAFSAYLNLLSHVWDLWKEGDSLQVVDEKIVNNAPVNEIIKCIKIGLLCVQERPENRPLMPTVIEMFSKDITLLPEPNPPGFVTRFAPLDIINIQKQFSLNHVSITSLGGR